MTVAVCHVMPALDVAPRQSHARTAPMPMTMPPQQLDMWSAIQADDGATKPALAPEPAKASYPVKTVRRSMSHESLDLCTESLGSETGTRGDFLDQAAIMACLYAPPSLDTAADSFAPPPALHEEEEQVQEQEETVTAGLTEVRYHRARPQRAFPPPLASMSRRPGDDAGPCLRMRPHRRDGRLVVEAVAARPQGYLHARRQDGRLRLCFVDCASSSSVRGDQKQCMVQQVQVQELEEELVREEEDDEAEEEEDEVQVVDRGTVVEVVAASGKAQRCSKIVINKFVGGAPDVSPSRYSASVAAEDDAAPPVPGLRRVPSSTTTLAAAVAAASTGMDEADEEEIDEADNGEQAEEKQIATMLFTSRMGDRAELVQSVRRCRQLRQRPLFIVEPYTIIAT
ncbi:unnamed protein product [Alopecurus aequalis]